MLTQKMKRKIRNVLSVEKPTLHIGKEGPTPQIVNEAIKQLDTREMIKVKILKTALEETKTKTIAARIAKQTESELVEVRGHVFLLFKNKKKR